MGPYIEGSLKVTISDYAVIRMSVPEGTNLEDEKTKSDFEDKLATIYVTGKSRAAKRRKKRAVGSVSAKVRVTKLLVA